MGRVRHLEGDGDEAVEVYGRTDHAILREHEAGSKTGDVCRKHGISSATFYKWKAKYGGLDVSEARRLKVLAYEKCEAEEAVGRGDARRRHAEGPQFKKMVTPVARRQAVAHLCSLFEVSQRRACEVIGADRSAVRYLGLRPDDATIRVRLRELASARRRFGYPRLLLLIRSEGVLINHKKLRRLYTEERLQVRRRVGRKKSSGNTGSDGVADRTSTGRWISSATH